MQTETCAEKIDLADFRIRHSKCIDERLIAGRTGRNLNGEKDKYQRELCGCVTSCASGAYNTCGHHCVYCYANVSRKKTEKNQLLHDDHSPVLCPAAEVDAGKI